MVLNQGKVGKPYEYSDVLIIAGFAVKAVNKCGYRQAAGTVAEYLSLNGINKSPDFRTIQWRISQLKESGIKFMIYENCGRDIEVLIDASGIKSVKDGEYRSTKYGKIKMWEKIHIAIDRKTRRILNMIVTGNEVGDIREFIPLMDPIVKMNDVAKVTADGAYDAEEHFKYCDNNGIEPILPVHITATGKRGRHRKPRVEEQLGVIRRTGRNRNRTPPKERRRAMQEEWKRNSGYHYRSLVETAFSVFKGAFGEYTFSRNVKMKKKELLLKAVVYNRFLA